MISEFYNKSSFLKNHKYQDLISKICKSIKFNLGNEGTSSTPNGQIKSIQLDLSYIFFRHQAWIHAPVLMELTIDYLNSEYSIPHQKATQVVETCLDLLNAYIPMEKGWSSEDYDREFLFQLFISSASSEDESSLRTDIGFGDNVIQLLVSAASLHEERNSIVFAPDLTKSLNQMMTEISQEIKETPWIIDLYKLKRILESGELHNKHQFTRQYLEFCFEIMNAISWAGTTFNALMDEKSEALIKKALNQLIGAELIFVQGAGKRVSYHLSQIGIDLIAERTVAQLGHIESRKILDLPGPVQVKLLQKNQFDIAKCYFEISPELHKLDPKAIFVLFSRIGKEKPGTISEVLPQLPYNRLNSWAKCELCRALSDFEESKQVETFFESVIRNDPSIKVREKARSSLKDWRRSNRSSDKLESSNVIKHRSSNISGVEPG